MRINIKAFALIAIPTAFSLQPIAYCGTAATSIDYSYLAANAQVVTSPIDGQLYYKLDDMLFPVPEKSFKGCTINNITLWPDGVIKYKFTNQWHPTAIDPSCQDIFRVAANEWSKGGTITMIEDESANDYYVIPFSGSENGAGVGMSTGGWYNGGTIEILDWNVGTVAHEIGHSIGLYHEHQRQDRNPYITINLDNIPQEYQGSFSVITPSRQAPLLTEYDFLSIMHYNQNAFSTGGTTITCNAGYEQYQRLIGQRCMISALDRVAVAKLYGKPDPGLCSIVISVEDAKLGDITIGNPGGYGQFSSDNLTQANPGVPVTLTLVPYQLSLFGGWEADNAEIDDPTALTVNVTPLGDCAVRVVRKTFSTSFEGTTGTIVTIDAPAAFPARTSFSKGISAKVGGKPAKIKATTSFEKATLELTSAMAAGTYPILIKNGSNGTSQTCSFTVKPPEDIGGNIQWDYANRHR